MMIHSLSKKPDILLVTINFPTMDSNRDGMGNYIAKSTECLINETGWNIRAVAFRFAGQEHFEERNGLTIQRIDPPGFITHYNEIYDARNFRLAVTDLALAAAQAAAAAGAKIPAWCHGYESGAAVKKLHEAGFSAAGSVHYLVAEELFYRFENAKDPLRKDHLKRTLTSITGRWCPVAMRPFLIRTLSLFAPALCNLPLHARLEMFYKLKQESLLMKYSKRVVAVSSGFSSKVASYYPDVREKIRFCTAGTPTPASGTYWPFPLRDDRIRLVMVGRPAPQKGWDYVAAALGNIESSSPEKAAKVELVIIGGLGYWGGDYGSRVNDWFLSLGKVSVANLGEIPNQEVQRVMSAADALLMPSTFEPFGLVMVEAMANGCMVLSSDSDGPRDTVKAPWGIQMKFDDPGCRVREVETGIRMLLSLTRKELDDRGEAARKAAGLYSWSESARTHAEVLRQLRD